MFLTPAYSVGVFFLLQIIRQIYKITFYSGCFCTIFLFLSQDCIEYFVGADWFSGGDVYCVEVEEVVK